LTSPASWPWPTPAPEPTAANSSSPSRHAHLTGNHTIFGEVVEGQEIATKISLVPRGGQDKPKTPVVLESVVIERVG